MRLIRAESISIEVVDDQVGRLFLVITFHGTPKMVIVVWLYRRLFHLPLR